MTKRDENLKVQFDQLVAQFGAASERFEKARARYENEGKAEDFYAAENEMERMLSLSNDILGDDPVGGDAYRRSAYNAMGWVHQTRTERELLES